MSVFPPTPEIPDAITPLSGYRAWRISVDPSGRLRLRSLYRPTAWPYTGHIVASCIPGTIQHLDIPPPHDAPGGDCTCGIHALAVSGPPTLDAAVSAIHRAMGHPSREPITALYGTMAAWGAIEVGSRGFRAQRGRVESILGVYPLGLVSPHVLRRLSDLYGVPGYQETPAG